MILIAVLSMYLTYVVIMSLGDVKDDGVQIVPVVIICHLLTIIRKVIEICLKNSGGKQGDVQNGLSGNKLKFLDSPKKTQDGTYLVYQNKLDSM